MLWMVSCGVHGFFSFCISGAVGGAWRVPSSCRSSLRSVRVSGCLFKGDGVKHQSFSVCFSASDSIGCDGPQAGGVKLLAEVSSCRWNLDFRNNLAYLNVNGCKVFLPVVANVKANDSGTQKRYHADYKGAKPSSPANSYVPNTSPPAAIGRAAVNRRSLAREPLFMSAHVPDAA